MKWRTHLIIAKWVGEKVGFTKLQIFKLAKGSILPDTKRFRFYHHNEEFLQKEIVKNIFIARKLFLLGNEKFLIYLGIALHYIQDRFVKLRSRFAHINIEQEIEKIRFEQSEKSKSYDIKDIIENLNISDDEKNFLITPYLIDGANETIKIALITIPPKIDSSLAFYLARRASLGVTIGVTKKDAPLLIIEKIKQTYNKINKNKIKFLLHLILSNFLVMIFLFTNMKWLSILILLNTTLLKIFSKDKIKNYLNIKNYLLTIIVLFLLIGLTFFIFNFFLQGVLTILFAICHLLYPKIKIDDEIKLESAWYKRTF